MEIEMITQLLSAWKNEVRPILHLDLQDDQAVDEVHERLAAVDRIQEQLAGGLAAAEPSHSVQELVAECVAIQRQVIERLSMHQHSISGELVRLRQRRQSKRLYKSPKIQVDGYFVDQHQ